MLGLKAWIFPSQIVSDDPKHFRSDSRAVQVATPLSLCLFTPSNLFGEFSNQTRRKRLMLLLDITLGLSWELVLTVI